MLLLEFSISPLGKGDSVSQYVARSIEIVEQSGLDYRLHAMGTILEGEWDQVFGVVKQCFERMSKDCDRVTLSIKADFRRGHSGRLEAKVRSVEEKLGRKLKSVYHVECDTISNDRFGRSRHHFGTSERRHRGSRPRRTDAGRGAGVR